MIVTLDPNLIKIDKHSGFVVSKAMVNLLQVTRDGKLKMKILSPILSKEIVKSFKNNSIKINLLQNGNSIDVKFKVENRDTFKSMITLRLSFYKPSEVSIEQELD